MSHKRRAPASFEWSRVPDDDDLPPNINIHHTHLDLDPSGSSFSQATYISAPASPSKKVGPSDHYHDSYNWNDKTAPPEINITNFPFLDPEYVHFLDINELEPYSTRGLSWLVFILRSLLFTFMKLMGFQDNPLVKWIPEQNKFLQELLCLDGHGDDELWSECHLYQCDLSMRCKDCYGGKMFCEECMVDLHAINPFHQIEVSRSIYHSPV
jgi:hypothetical protein